MKKIIELDNLTKSFDGQVILKGIHLDIYENEFVTLLGPSGCGKTTTLRIMAGFEEPESGTVLFDGMNMEGVPPYKRELNTVFQKYALFPHMDVYDNVAFGLHIKKMPDEIIDHKVRRMLELVGLKGFEERNISQLSGGQQQRVAIARALVNEPKVLLLDEPFSSLDENLQCEMADLVRKLHHEMGLTVVMVTHDKEEAMKVSDRIALMKAGEVLQYDKPERMFYHPESRAVADYMGQTNYIFGKVENGSFVSREVSFETQKAEGEYELMVRPSAITLTVDETERMNQIEEVMIEGETAEILLKYADGKLTVWMLHRDWMKLGVKTGELVGIKIDERQGILFQK